MSAKEQILKCIVNRMSAVNPLNIYKIILKSLFTTYHLLRSLLKVIVKMIKVLIKVLYIISLMQVAPIII